MRIVETSQHSDFDLVLQHRLLGCWVVYRVGAHLGCDQGSRMTIASILIEALTILGFKFFLDHIRH
jgi:hypothetical protein